MSLAVVVIASEKRMNSTFWPAIQSVVDEKPDELVVVADFHCAGNFRHIMIPAFTKSTLDALIKRDVGAVATVSDMIMYLSDDHRLAPGFVENYRRHWEGAHWDILAPSRFCMKDEKPVRLNMGQGTRYVAGHGGIYRRAILRSLPWTATIPHPNWDVIHSHHLVANGAQLSYAGAELAIEDIEGGRPWI